MMHIAIHDALNAIEHRYLSYAYDKPAVPGASPEAAVAAAARDVLVPLIKQLPSELVAQSCIDAGVSNVEADYATSLAGIPSAPAKALGISVGQAAARAILTKRAADGVLGPFLNHDCPHPTCPARSHAGHPPATR
jgi:hypothetical protein